MSDAQKPYVRRWWQQPQICVPETIEDTLALIAQERSEPRSLNIRIGARLFEDIANRIIALENEARRG